MGGAFAAASDNASATTSPGKPTTRELDDLRPNNVRKMGGLGKDLTFVAATAAHPACLEVVEALLGGPIKRVIEPKPTTAHCCLAHVACAVRSLCVSHRRPPTDWCLTTLRVLDITQPHSNRGLYGIFPAAESGGPLGPHHDFNPMELAAVVYLSQIGRLGGGYTVCVSHCRCLCPAPSS